MPKTLASVTVPVVFWNTKPAPRQLDRDAEKLDVVISIMLLYAARHPPARFWPSFRESAVRWMVRLALSVKMPPPWSETWLLVTTESSIVMVAPEEREQRESARART